MAHEAGNISSPDDALEESRSAHVADLLRQQRLEEDNDRPAAPADNSFVPHLPDDHPALDTDMDPGEMYDVGEEGALNLPDDLDSEKTDIEPGARI